MNKSIVKKTKLFYNKFKYKARVNALDAHFLQYSKTEEILFERIVKHHNYTHNYSRASTKQSLPHNQDVLNGLLCYIQNNYSKIKVRYDYHHLSIFSNDFSVLEKLKDICGDVKYTEISLEGDPNVKVMVNPKHTFRVYFKSKIIPNSFIEDLKEFLIRYENTAFPSGALKKWLYISDKRKYWRQKYVDSSYFIDYDNDSFSTILQLNFDNFLGKTYKLVKR